MAEPATGTEPEPESVAQPVIGATLEGETSESAQRPPPAAPPAPPSTDEPPSPPDPPPAPRPPSDYRPDLRPMLILAALLVGVIIGWLVLSPLILPGR